MTAWGVVAVCAIGGGVAGPLVERMARRVPRHVSLGAGAALVASATVASATVAVPGSAPTTLGAGSSQPSLSAETARASVVGGATASPVAGSSAGSVAVAGGSAGEPGGPLGPAPEAPQLAGSVAEIVVVTLVTAAAFALAAVRLGAVPSLAGFCALFAGLVAISVADLRTSLVPRRLLYPTLGVVAAGLAAASADSGSWRSFLDAAIGGVVAFVVFYAVWWVYPKGLGFGDVRLAGLCGLALGFLGFRQLYIGFLAAFLLGALGGVVALARRGSRRFPFAPALAVGTALGVLWGGWLGNLWLHPG